MVRILDSDGTSRDINWTADQRDVGAVAISPSSGNVHAVFNSHPSVGVESGDGFSIVAMGTFVEGNNRVSRFANWSPSSVAMDTRCLWIPNFAGLGSISCVTSDGAQEVLTTLSGYIEALALDVDGALLASVGEILYRVDPNTGAATVRTSAGAVVLDVAVDYDGTLFIETTSREIERHNSDAGQSSVFASVEGDGKLAISPDGWLVRVVPVVNGTSTWQEWDLNVSSTD